MLPALLTTATLCTVAFAQHTLVERTWPIACNQNDEFTAMTAGRLVKNYAARCVAVTHDNRLWLVAQPTLLWAASDVTPAGVASVHGVATLVAPPTAEADRLAVITNNGLQVVRDAGAGQMVSASASLAAWSTVRKIDAFSGVDGNPDLHLIAGVADTANNRTLRLVQYNAATELFSHSVAFDVPSAIFDVTIGDRDADLAPEVSVVGALGLALYSPTGVFITGYGQALTQGFVVARRDAFRNIVMLVNASGTWFLTSFTPANALVGHGVIPGGFASPVRGITVGVYDSDAYPDLIVSTEGTVRRRVPGLGGGAFDVVGIASINDCAGASNGAHNRCPALLDDIDRNGKMDIVIASTAHSALIAQSSVAPLSQTITVAQSGDETYWSALELQWPTATSSMLGAKFVVPPGTVSANVILWRLPYFSSTATEVDATGVVNTIYGSATALGAPGIFVENGETLLTVKLVLTNENGGNLFGNGGITWDNGECFMLEVRANPDPSTGEESVSAVFTFAAMQAGETWAQMMARLVPPPTSPYPVDGWLELMDFEQEVQDPPPTTPNTQDPLKPAAGTAEKGDLSGDRFVGGQSPIRVRIPTKLKQLPPAQPD